MAGTTIPCEQLNMPRSVRTCPKCGQPSVSVYDNGRILTPKLCRDATCLGKNPKMCPHPTEHLHLTCLCGNTWLERTEDDPVSIKYYKEIMERRKLESAKEGRL